MLVSNPTKTGIMSASVQGSSFSMADILNKDASNSRPSSAAPSGAPASTASSGGSNHVQVRFSIFCLKECFVTRQKIIYFQFSIIQHRQNRPILMSHHLPIQANHQDFLSR